MPDQSLTREELYALVWSEPMIKVAERFDVSSSYMARFCTLLDIPRPQRGYWARVEAGRTLPIPPLPEAEPDGDLVYSLNSHAVTVERPLPQAPSKSRKRKSKVKTERPSQHPLVKGAKQHFESGRLSYRSDYLKPAKWTLIDLAVTKTGLDKALTFANELFLYLEDRGHRVVLSPNGAGFYRAEVDEREVPKKRQGYYSNNLWSPHRCTVVYVGTVAIGLTIIEMSEEVEVRSVSGKYVRVEDYIPPKRGYDHSWATTREMTTGRLCLQAYSPYGRATWSKRWQEGKKRDLCRQIKTIARELEHAAVDIARMVEEGRRQAERERQQWKIEEAQRRKIEAERRAIEARKKSRDEIFQIISEWDKANQIEQFFRDAEQRVASLDEEERARLLERLKLARELIGSIDALEHFMSWKLPEKR